MARDGFGREAIAQPLATPPGETPLGHPRGDWIIKTRTTTLEALRYSRFVGFMKRILPLGAAAIVASVVAYSMIPRHQDRVSLTYQSVGHIHNDLAMLKPRLSGTDPKGNPFVITAEAAIQDSVNRHRAQLKRVAADMQFDNKKWLSATAEDGFFDMDAGTLKLDGGIALYTDSGYELHTNSADVNIKKNLFQGHEKVAGHGPLGSLSADRFLFDRLNKQVRLSGNVHMTMYPNKAKQ